MSLFRRLFQFDRDPHGWERFAGELGGRLAGHEGWQPGRMMVRREPWTLVLDVHSYPGWRMSEHYTRLRAAYVSLDNFRVTLWPRELLSSLAPPDELKRAPSGVAELDARFYFRTTSPPKLRELLGDAELARQMLSVAGLHLQILRQDGEPLAPEFPAQVHELCIEVPGDVGDAQPLHQMCDLAVQTLWGLCRIGSAQPVDPHVTP